MKVTCDSNENKAGTITITSTNSGESSDWDNCTRLLDAIIHDVVTNDNARVILNRIVYDTCGILIIPTDNYNITELRTKVKLWQAIADSDVGLPAGHTEFIWGLLD